MSAPKMPRDANNHPIPALRARTGGALRATTTDATAKRIGPFTDGTMVIDIYCRSAALRYQTGGADVVATATSHFLDVGERLIRSVGSKEASDLHTHISIVREGATDGTLEVTELE